MKKVIVISIGVIAIAGIGYFLYKKYGSKSNQNQSDEAIIPDTIGTPIHATIFGVRDRDGMDNFN